MIVKKITYSEHHYSENFWELKDCDFQEFNFIVGKNSTGKSRTLSVLFNTAKLISGEIPTVYSNGNTKIEFHEASESSNDSWVYNVEISDFNVISEQIIYNGKPILNRNRDGSGSVFYDSVDDFLEVKLSNNQLAIAKYQDEIQQPAIHKIVQWAKKLSRVNFGTDMGQNRFLTEDSYTKIFKSNSPINETASEQYIVGYNLFGQEFDEKIINDMSRLNYKLKDINFGPAKIDLSENSTSIFGLHTVEEGLNFDNSQIHLSQGMYRALATIITINFKVLCNEPATILIDDIGEGLDFERSSELVKIILEKTKNSNIQMIMTSNDQFIMNAVPLENWIILKRINSTVISFTNRNSKEKFEEFKFVGLNNFEFFSMGFFDKE